MSDEERKRALRELGGRLQALRLARGLTQEAVAERAALSTQSISDIERGRRDVPVLTLRRIAAAIGCEVGEVFSDVRADPAIRVAESTVGYGLPKDVQLLARDLANLDGRRRKAAIAAVRNVLSLAKPRR